MPCTGFDGSLGIGSAGADIDLVATYTECPNAGDVNVTINGDKADTSSRKSPFKTAVMGGLDCEITATIVYDPNDTTIATLRTACINRTALTVCACVDSLDIGTEGIAFEAHVFSTDIAQPLSEGQTYSVSFAPASSGNAPEWVQLA